MRLRLRKVRQVSANGRPLLAAAYGRGRTRQPETGLLGFWVRAPSIGSAATGDGQRPSQLEPRRLRHIVDVASEVGPIIACERET